MAERIVKNKNRRNKRKRKKAYILTFLIILIIGVMFTLSFTVFFPVKQIEVEGIGNYSYEEIVNYSTVKYDENLFLLSEDEIEKNIIKNLPFIKSVEIERKLPSTLLLKITETTEFYLFKIGDKYYSCDTSYKVLKEYTEKPVGLIFVDCSVSLKEDTVKEIEFSNEKEKEVADKVIKASSEFPFCAQTLDIKDIYSIRMTFDDRFEVYFGDSNWFSEKMAHLTAMVKTMDEETKGKIDLSNWNPDNHQSNFVERW